MNKLKQFIKRMPFLGELLIVVNKLFFQKRQNFDSPAIWLKKLLTGDKIQIVQIGSNDGVSGDPIYDLVKCNTKWKGLFVEPIPYLFEKLKENYVNDSRFVFENAAINDGSQQVFYTVKKDAKEDMPDLPIWYDQLGSFNKSHILKHLDGILEPYIEELLLKGLTLEELFTRNNIKDISLLHIDTEGHDWNILSQLNLDIIKPEIILIEYKHLTQVEKDNMIHFLKKIYSLYRLGGDVIAIIKNHENKWAIKRLKGQPIA